VEPDPFEADPLAHVSSFVVDFDPFELDPLPPSDPLVDFDPFELDQLLPSLVGAFVGFIKGVL
jgi:hypothetical protein